MIFFNKLNSIKNFVFQALLVVVKLCWVIIDILTWPLTQFAKRCLPNWFKILFLWGAKSFESVVTFFVKIVFQGLSLSLKIFFLTLGDMHNSCARFVVPVKDCLYFVFSNFRDFCGCLIFFIIRVSRFLAALLDFLFFYIYYGLSIVAWCFFFLHNFLFCSFFRYVSAFVSMVSSFLSISVCWLVDVVGLLGIFLAFLLKIITLGFVGVTDSYFINIRSIGWTALSKLIRIWLILCEFFTAITKYLDVLFTAIIVVLVVTFRSTSSLFKALFYSTTALFCYLFAQVHLYLGLSIKSIISILKKLKIQPLLNEKVFVIKNFFSNVCGILVSVVIIIANSIHFVFVSSCRVLARFCKFIWKR